MLVCLHQRYNRDDGQDTKCNSQTDPVYMPCYSPQFLGFVPVWCWLCGRENVCRWCCWLCRWTSRLEVFFCLNSFHPTLSYKRFSASLPLVTELSCNVWQQLRDRFDPSLKTFWRDTLVWLTWHHRYFWYFLLDFQCSHNCVWVMFAWYYTFLL